ncbi:MAG: hypothetical protein ACRC9K_24125 [Afipia sp.]
MAEYVEIPDAAKRPKPLFPALPEFSIVREVREWVTGGNATYDWRGHTHTTPGEDEPVDFIGFFELPKGTEAPCPCCTPNHTKFGKGVVGWFPVTHFIRLMGEDCFKRLNPQGYRDAKDRLEQRQGRRSTVNYLTANLHKKGEFIAALERVEPLAEHLDDLQMILGERLRKLTGVDLWQAVREGGNLKVVVETERGSFNSNYASVAGYRLVDPVRKKLAPMITTALRWFRAIELHANIADATDAERTAAARSFGKGIPLARDLMFDLEDLRKFVSIETTATIRNWSRQRNATAQIYMRREGRTVLIGKNETVAKPITLREVIDSTIPALPSIVITAD